MARRGRPGVRQSPLSSRYTSLRPAPTTVCTSPSDVSRVPMMPAAITGAPVDGQACEVAWTVPSGKRKSATCRPSSQRLWPQPMDKSSIQQADSQSAATPEVITRATSVSFP
jgi:hypothetical protein